MSLLCDVEFSFGVVTVNAKTAKKSDKNYAFGSVCKVLLDEADDDNIPTFFDLLNSEKRG